MKPVLLAALILVLQLQACVSVNSGVEKDNRQKAAQYNAQLGINYMTQQGDLEQARIKLEKALEQDEDNALANLGYARLQAVVGDSKKANKHFQRAIALEPLNADQRNAYGVYLCQQGDLNAALDEFDAAVENKYYKTPEYALDNAGLCLLNAGNDGDAEDYLVKAVTRNPRYAPALLNLADLNLRREKLELASAYYGRYEKIGKETPNSLWIGYQIRDGRGEVGKASSLSDKLLRNYPTSKQAGELLKSTAND